MLATCEFEFLQEKTRAFLGVGRLRRFFTKDESISVLNYPTSFFRKKTFIICYPCIIFKDISSLKNSYKYSRQYRRRIFSTTFLM